MTAGGRRFLRDNVFLVAAVTLPLLVVVLFLGASAVSRSLVAPPAYDFLLRTPAGREGARPNQDVTISVRDGRVEATVHFASTRPAPSGARLFLFEHETLTTREIPLDLPEVTAGDPPITVVVGALAARRVLAEPRSPDGYELDTRSGGMGLIGALFGMGRSGPRIALVKAGRTVPITLPSTVDWYGFAGVGWVLEEGSR